MGSHVIAGGGSLPAGLESVALVGMPDICAAARVVESTVREDIKRGLLSEPIRFGPRCSRWPVADVRQYLTRRIDEARAKSAEYSRVAIDRATMASRKGVDARRRKKESRDALTTGSGAAA